jgi:hypothetical protein
MEEGRVRQEYRLTGTRKKVALSVVDEKKRAKDESLKR